MNKAANQRFDSCEPAIKVGDLYRYTKNNADPPWPMQVHQNSSAYFLSYWNTKMNRDPPRQYLDSPRKYHPSNYNHSQDIAWKPTRDIKPPLPPPFEIHAPKTIGHLLGLVPIYLASTILLTKSVLKISRGKQNMVKASPLPSLWRYMHQKQQITSLYQYLSTPQVPFF